MNKLLACSCVTLAVLTESAPAATINGQVIGAGRPVANSTVTLWAASAGNPKQVAQTRSGADGRFSLTAPSAGSESLYLVAVALTVLPSRKGARSESPEQVARAQT